MMRKLISVLTIPVIATVGIGISCSDKYGSLVNNTEILKLTSDKSTLTIREQDYSNINSTNDGTLVLQAKYPTNMKCIQVEEISGRVHVLYKGQQIRSPQSLPVTGDSMPIFVTCDAPGNYILSLILTDNLGRASQTEILVKCQVNKPPKSNCISSLIDSSISENWRYLIDASGSKDSDGIIREYHFFINGQSVVTNQSAIHYTFHTRGIQIIKHFAIDDLGASSDSITQQIYIP